MNLDRITHPLRLAAGSHQPGSGKGCAMNVVSFINGDAEITDFPDCSQPVLARLVQRLNDKLAGDDGFLSPVDSILVLDLGWRTVGTASFHPSVGWRWMAEVLIDPVHGVAQFSSRWQSVWIHRVASLCLRAAAGEWIASGLWAEAAAALEQLNPAKPSDYAKEAAWGIARGNIMIAAVNAAAAHGIDWSSDPALPAAIEFVRWAIERWRTLAGIADAPGLEPSAVNSALERMYS